MRHLAEELVFLVKYEQLVILLDVEVIVEADIMKHAIYCRQQNASCSLQRPKIGKFVDEIEIFEKR